MLELLHEDAPPVLVQGITGRAGRRQTALMRAYGTNIVAGVSPNRAEANIEGVPVFRSCREAVAATGARCAVMFVPPAAVLGALTEAVEAGLSLIVTLAEGMPVHQALEAVRRARSHGASWVGPSSPGVAAPGRYKMGFIPDVALAPGAIGIMAKSGTLAYEVCHRLAARGLGQSVWIGVGGDAVKGLRFAELVPFFATCARTRALLVIGEIGGTEEEDLARALTEAAFPKPVHALIAGRHAREGVTLGHAGALIHGAHGTYQAKRAALEAAGARVHDCIAAIVESLAADPALRHHEGRKVR